MSIFKKYNLHIKLSVENVRKLNVKEIYWVSFQAIQTHQM